jgi:hypothetical protein
MALVLKYDEKGFSLKSADGSAAYNVNPAQTKSWQVALEQQAKQLGFIDAKQMLAITTVTVPTAGDSQYKIAEQFGLDMPTAYEMVRDNVQFTNPDLIHAYHEGDLKADFVVVPKTPAEPIPGSDAPAGTPEGTKEKSDATVLGSDAPAGATDAMKKQSAIETIKNSNSPDERKAAIAAYLDEHNGSIEDRTKAAIALLDPNQNYGDDVNVRSNKRREILDELIPPYTDPGKTKAIFDSLLEHTWTSTTGVTDKSMDQLIGQHAKDKYGIECDPVKWND